MEQCLLRKIECCRFEVRCLCTLNVAVHVADGTSPLGSMTRCYEQTVASFFNPHSNELYVPVTSQQQDLRFAPITATPPSLPRFFHTSPLALSSSRCRWTNPAGPLPRPTHRPVLPSAAGSPARADPQPGRS